MADRLSYKDADRRCPDRLVNCQSCEGWHYEKIRGLLAFVGYRIGEQT